MRKYEERIYLGSTVCTLIVFFSVSHFRQNPLGVAAAGSGRLHAVARLPRQCSPWKLNVNSSVSHLHSARSSS